MGKLRVLLLAGGQSGEHPISLLSARGVLAALAQTSFAVTFRVLAQDGRLLDEAGSQAALAHGSAATGPLPLGALADLTPHVDVVFPLLHGPHGEDGTIQGLLTLLNVAFVGSGVLSSALCMDKPMAKDVLAKHAVPQVPYRMISRQALAKAGDPRALVDTMAPPWFVKPANLGSSIGVAKAKDTHGLATALREAMRLDRRAIVEAAVHAPRELEVAVLGNDDPQASVVGEITYDGEFYDYASKYTEGRAQIRIPAAIDDSVTLRVQAMARQAFLALDCAGLARVDFFYEPHADALWLNEVNTMPGFTPFSMYPAMWAATGLAYAALLTCLIELACERGPSAAR